MKSFFFFVTLLTLSLSLPQPNYYWRPFNGTIPSDAVDASQEPGFNVHIGQAYFKEKGIFHGPLVANQTTLTAAAHGIITSNIDLKILCGPSGKFIWINTSSQSFDYDMYNKTGIIGTWDAASKLENLVGRIIHDGEMHYGIMDMSQPPNRTLHYELKGTEMQSKGPFQILTYLY